MEGHGMSWKAMECHGSSWKAMGRDARLLGVYGPSQLRAIVERRVHAPALVAPVVPQHTFNEPGVVYTHPVFHLGYRQRPKDDKTFFLRRKKMLFKDRKFVPDAYKHSKGGHRRRSSLLGTSGFGKIAKRPMPPAFHWFKSPTGGSALSCPACGKEFKTMGDVHRHHVRFHHPNLRYHHGWLNPQATTSKTQR